MTRSIITYSMMGRGPFGNLVQFDRRMTIQDIERFIHGLLIQGGDHQPMIIRVVTRGGATIDMEIVP
jgi:hypothetical protein